MQFFWKFILAFAICYIGTLAVIGIAAPGNYYSPFVDNYLDYVSWIKNSLITGARFILSLFNVETFSKPGFIVGIYYGKSVLIAMDCVGYGVYSFWVAYVFATESTLKRKLFWMIGGLFLLWLINTIRITLFLWSLNQNLQMPFNIDHHTWFNIFAYLAIFTMMYFLQRSLSKLIIVRSDER